MYLLKGQFVQNIYDISLAIYPSLFWFKLLGFGDISDE